MFNQPCRRNGHALLLARDAAFSGSPKKTLDNPATLRENGRVITVVDRRHGR